MTRLAIVVSISMALMAAASGQAPQTPQTPQGVSRTVLVDNATVLVARLRYEAGKGETSHTHPFSAVVLQITSGIVNMTIGPDNLNARRDAGAAWFIPQNMPHYVMNAGTDTFEQIAITIKPTRTPPPAAPPPAAVPGITRTTVIDNRDTRVIRVQFAPGAREPLHAHPYDLLTVQLTPGGVESQSGSEKTTAERTPGFVQFVPRGVQHAFASADKKPFEVASVTIK
jgi:quercetin dioxygenase-like cupin family protein